MTFPKAGRKRRAKLLMWIGLPMFALAATVLYVQIDGPGTALAQEASPAPGASLFSTTRVLGVLFIVFFLLFGLAFLARTYLVPFLTRQKNLQSMRVIESMVLTPKSRLMLVEIGQKLFVLGVTEDNISLLYEFTDREEFLRVRENSGRGTPSFQDYLQKLK